MFSFRCIALSNSCIRDQFGQANKNALHCYTKANRTLGFLRRNLYSCPQEVRLKKAAYKGLVHPVLHYGSSVWDPPGVVLQEFPGNYSYETGSMTGILGQLKWESLNKRRKDSRLILLYKDLKGKASVPTDDLIPRGARWLSGRVSDSGARGPGFETYLRRVVSLSKTLYSPKVLVKYPGSDGSVPT